MNGQRKNGFSLVEIVIAMAIGAIVIAGMYAAFNTLQKWWVAAGMRSDLQQNVRAGLETVTRDLEMAGYQTTNYGDPNKAGLAITLASAHEIEVDEQRPESATITSANVVFQPRLVYYHLATDMNTERQNLYRQIRTQPGLATTDEIVAENISEFNLVYLDKDNNPVDCLFTYVRPVGRIFDGAGYEFGKPRPLVDDDYCRAPAGACPTRVPCKSDLSPSGLGPDPLKNIRRIQVTLTGIPPGATTLAAAANPGDTTLTVASTKGFPPSGKIDLYESVVAYTSKDETRFEGCTGVVAPLAVGHVVARAMPIGRAPKPFTMTASVIPQNLSAADEVAAAGGGADITPPAIPAGLVVIDTRSCIEKLRVKWNPNTEPDLDGYLLFYGPTGSRRVPLGAIDKSDPRVTLNPENFSVTKCADRITSPNIYSIQIAAYDSSGNYSAKSAPVSGNPSPDVTAFTQSPFFNDSTVNPAKPAPPTGLTVTPGADGELVLSWTASADATQGYRLYRGTAAFATWPLVNTSLQIANESALSTDATTWTDRNLDCGTYHYALASVGCDETLEGCSPYGSGDYAVASGTALKTTPPPAPKLACSPGMQQINVTLENPLADACPDFDRTEMYWSKVPTAAPHFNGTVVGDGTPLPDSDSGSPGTFRNRGSQVVVFDSETEAVPAGGPSLEPPAVPGETVYNLLAVSYDRCGNNSESLPAGCTDFPPPACNDDPAGPPSDSFTLGTKTTCEPESAVLGWEYDGTAVTDLAGFRIERAGPEGTVTLTDGPTPLKSWTDPGILEAGAAYTYTISATDYCWEQYLRDSIWPYADPPFAPAATALNKLALGPVYPGELERYKRYGQSACTSVPTSAPVTPADATIPIDDSSGLAWKFAHSGELFIKGHRVSCTGISIDTTNPDLKTFTGCTWADPSGATIDSNTAVYKYNPNFVVPTSAAVTSGDANIPIDSSGVCSMLTNSGQLSIGCNLVAYTGVTYTGSTPVAFTGCTWPANSSGYNAPVNTPVHPYGWAGFSAPENFVTSISDPSPGLPYRYHNNVKFYLQNTSRSWMTIKKMAVTWENPNVVLDRVTVGVTTDTALQAINAGGMSPGGAFNVNAEIKDVADGISSPSGPVPVVLRFTTPDGSVNRLTDMRGETLGLSLWVENQSFNYVECSNPTKIAVEVPRGPLLGGFSQSAPGIYGIDSYEVIGQSGTARDTDINVPYGVEVNVYGSVFDNSRDTAPDGCNMGFKAGYPEVVGIDAAAADPAAVPAMPTAGTFFERPLSILDGNRYTIYQASPPAGSPMPTFSNKVVWYYALAIDATGNWDRVPNPDYGDYAYFQPPFDVCTVTPRAPVLSLTATTTGADLAWTAPTEYDSGFEIVSGDTITYDVYVKSAGGDPWPAVPTASDLTGTSYTHSADLLTGTYYYMVRAKNSCATGARPSLDSNVVMECQGAAGIDCSLFSAPATARYGEPIALAVSDFCTYQGNGGSPDSVVFSVNGGSTTTNFAATESGDTGAFAKTITAVWFGGVGDQVFAPAGSLNVNLVIAATAPCPARTVALTGGPCPTTPKAPVMGSATRTSTSSSNNSFTLNFTAPTQNTDNTPLLDLTGYRLIYSLGSTAPTTFTAANSLDVGLITSPWTGAVGSSSAAGRYYFWLQAYDDCATRNYSPISNRVRSNQ